jgi:hypothetical protein
MPYMTEGIAKHVPEFEAWRWAFFLPGGLFIIITFLILILGQVSSFIFRCYLNRQISISLHHSGSSAVQHVTSSLDGHFPFARHAAPKQECLVDGFVASICIWTVVSCHT